MERERAKVFIRKAHALFREVLARPSATQGRPEPGRGSVRLGARPTAGEAPAD